MSPSTSSEKGLPTNLEAERFVLGSILMDDTAYIQCAGVLEPFSLRRTTQMWLLARVRRNSAQPNGLPR